MLVVDEGMNRQQLDRRYPELLDMAEQLVAHQPGKGTAVGLRHRRVAHADAAHMGFVEDGALPGDAHALVAAPGVGRIDDLALGYERRAVALIEAEVAIGVADGVAEQCFGPFQATDQLLGVGVDQQLVGIEAVAVFRGVRAVYPVAVDLPGVGVGQVAVEDLIGVFRQLDTFELDLAAGIEQAQLDLGGVGREQREVDPQPIPGSPQGEGQAFADARGFEVNFGGRLGFADGHLCSLMRLGLLCSPSPASRLPQDSVQAAPVGAGLPAMLSTA
ncbi:hypothetical protein D3C81_986890 [compost metagenome]